MRPALKRVIAAAELLLIFPAALFMTALFARNLQPPQLEPAHTAQQIVLWYSGRLQFGLYVLLMTMPLIVLVMGCVTLLRSWQDDAELPPAAQQMLAAVRAHLATALIAAATVMAAGILVIVALHALSD